jgi:putative hydrolase of the HAD superfamily
VEANAMAITTLAQTVASKKAVIFDLFHTLTALEIVGADHLPPTHTMLGVSQEAWNAQLELHSRDRLVGSKTDAVAIIGEMAHAIQPSITDDVIQAATENRIARFAAAIVGVPEDTREVLRTLKSRGKRVGLISNADVMEVAAWNRCPIAAIFDSTVFSCRAGCAKPEPEIYERSLRELGVRSDEAVFVGDGGSRELEGARRLGIVTVMVTGIIRKLWPERIVERRAFADFVVEHLKELIAGAPE